MHSVCTQHLRENMCSLFPKKLSIKSREWREMAQKSQHCQECRFSCWRVLCLRRHRWSQCPQHSPPLFPHLRHFLVETATFPQKKKKDSILMKHHFSGSWGNNPNPFYLQLKHWETEKLKGIRKKKELIWFLLFKLKEMQRVNKQLNLQGMGRIFKILTFGLSHLVY